MYPLPRPHITQELDAGLLHWFVGPYVHKLWHNAPSKQVKVEMRNVFVQKTCDALAFHTHTVPLPLFLLIRMCFHALKLWFSDGAAVYGVFRLYCSKVRVTWGRVILLLLCPYRAEI